LNRTCEFGVKSATQPADKKDGGQVLDILRHAMKTSSDQLKFKNHK